MAHYAKTRIDAGKDKDGKPRVFEIGQAVTGLPDDEVKQLVDSGALGDKPPTDDKDASARQPQSGQPASEPVTPENTRTRTGGR